MVCTTPADGGQKSELADECLLVIMDYTYKDTCLVRLLAFSFILRTYHS
jgi:hypothetical protein